MCKKFFTLLLFFFVTTNIYADLPHYIDFKFILNESTLEKSSDHLKNKFNKGIENIDKKRNLFKRRRKIIDQKKLIKPEEYKEKVNKLKLKYKVYKKREINYLKLFQNKEIKQKLNS